MFYDITARGHVRVPPSLFSEDPKVATLMQLRKDYDNVVSKDFGIVILVTEVLRVGEGIIIPGDGAAYYETRFKMLAYKPEIGEIVVGKVGEISDFGAFINIGPVDGMVHISQAMDDFVTYSKSGVLTGKESKRVLKVGDVCKARVIAVSYKDLANPKIGLTMRQPGLGKPEWIKELKDRAVVKAEKEEKKGKEGKREKAVAQHQ